MTNLVMVIVFGGLIGTVSVDIPTDSVQDCIIAKRNLENREIALKNNGVPLEYESITLECVKGD